MPWCPNCKIEYRDEISACSDCGAALVDEEPMEAQAEYIIDEPISLVLLADINDPFELDMLLPLLKQEKIIFVEKQKSSGGYLKLYMGNAGTSIFGTQIYVSSKDYTRAKELIDAYLDNNRFAQDVVSINDDISNPMTEAEIDYAGMSFEQRKDVSRISILLVIFTMPIIIWLLVFGLALLRTYWG